MLLPILVSTFAFAQAERLDPARPGQALEVSRKLHATTVEGEKAFFWWEGQVFSRVPAEKDRLLFRILGMNVRTTQSLKDPAKGAGYRMVSRELMFYLDPATSAILHTWKNPFTGRDVEVLQVANDPVNFPPIWENFPQPFRLEGTFSGGLYQQQMCVPLFYADPLSGPYQDAVGGQYQAIEILQFSALESELMDSKRSSADHVVLSWTRVSKWLPWMCMGDRTGQLIFTGLGQRVKRFEDLPELMKQEVLAHYPAFQEPPPLDDTRKNETSWTTYRKYMESKKAK
jgi:hypothetical protein